MKIYVRIHPKIPHQSFFRCGYKFGKNWTELDVDKATAVRLRSEQVLDVSDNRPTEMSGHDKPAGDIRRGQNQLPNPVETKKPKNTGKSKKTTGEPSDNGGANGQTDADAKQADTDKTGQASGKKGQ